MNELNYHHHFDWIGCGDDVSNQQQISTQWRKMKKNEKITDLCLYDRNSFINFTG